jgi:hypothetical protein
MRTYIRPVMAWRGAGLALGVLFVAAGATPQVTARQASTPARPAAQTARPIPASALQADAFVNRVWIVESATGITPGAFYVFLANGVLVISQEGGKPAFGSWAEAADGLVMTQGGLKYNVDVLELNPSRFRLRINNPKAATEIVFTPAVPRVEPPVTPSPETASSAAAAATPPSTPPVAAPAPRVDRGPLPSSYRCGADVYGVAFESGKAYITLADGQLLVLNEVTVKDALADRRTFSDGRLTFVEDTSEPYTRVLFARPGLRPRPCTSMR